MDCCALQYPCADQPLLCCLPAAECDRVVHARTKVKVRSIFIRTLVQPFGVAYSSGIIITPASAVALSPNSKCTGRQAHTRVDVSQTSVERQAVVNDTIEAMHKQAQIAPDV